MLFWILVAILTAAVAAVLLLPLMRGARAAADSRAGEAAVYRDQLQELERDRAGGLITAEEADYARAEIGRRLLGVASADKAAISQPVSLLRSRLAEIFIVVAVPATGLCLYLAVGSPDLPSQPLAARLEHPGTDMAILVAKAERHLAQNPEDGAGWDLLAPIYYKTARLDDAQFAYRNAIRILGPSPERLGGLAETLVAANDGIVTADARAAFEASLKLDAGNPRTKFYLALGLEQSGKTAEARAAFEALAKESPAGAPWLPLVNQHIATNGGVSAGAAADGKAPGNPTAADVAAAETMASGDRQKMIVGMVESLDAKLKDDPHNFEGWMRLIRSYGILKQPDKAADALKRGLLAFPAQSDEGQKLLGLAREMGLPAQEERK